MALTPGTRLGVYEVTAQIGAGGMGEVYRATDSNLKRSVAIKVLPASVAGDADRLARFQREAEVLAALNHPNIGAIYGLEKTPDFTALVMELVEGEDLSQRIARGAIPLDEALPIAKQIAEALEAAHEQGIIHRDLKPANIKLRPDGTVKVLDFGLAKAMEPAGASSANAMNSPTLSMHATQAGIILGTAAYMSPEQARGSLVDRRADIWAFGCVLFEMLTGRRAFEGETVSDTLAAVLKDRLAWDALPATMPPALRHLLERCLDRDPKSRLRDIGEGRVALATITSGAGAASRPPMRAATARVPWILTGGALAALAAVLVGWAPWRPMMTPPRPAVRFSVVPSESLRIQRNRFDPVIAISPDGSHIAYASAGGGLVVRAIDQLEAAPIRGTVGARTPFFSPDGQWIGFFDGVTALKKVSLAGGPTITICKISAPPRGASWGPDDTIVFATADSRTGLLSVSADGGEPKVLTRADGAKGEQDHWYPSVLPTGQAILFTVLMANGAENAHTAVLDRKTGQIKTLIAEATTATFVEATALGGGEPGYLLYGAAGTLRAVRFDVKTLAVKSEGVRVVEGLEMATNAAAQYSVSRGGTVTYLPGALNATGTNRLVWVDRQGHEDILKAPPHAYNHPRISPDGTRVSIDIRDLLGTNIWSWDLAGETLTRLTFESPVNTNAIWTPDGRRIIFGSGRTGLPILTWRSADGTGVDQPLTTSAASQFPSSVTPDGAHVLAWTISPNTGNDIIQVPLNAATSSAPAVTQSAVTLVQTKFNELNPEISPDGRYFAYQSDESGRYEIYVRPYPKVNDGRWMVSTGGGVYPVWARNGREMFYLAGDGRLTSAAVQTTGPTFSAGNPAALFDTKYATPTSTRTFDVSPDGRRFLMTKNDAADDNAPPLPMVVVLNGFEELKARMSTK